MNKRKKDSNEELLGNLRKKNKIVEGTIKGLLS